MLVKHRGWMVLSLVLMAMPRPARAQQQQYENGADGIRYLVTNQTVPTSVPVTETRPQQQTTYRQQVTTENVQHQQMYNVPVTQYQIVSELHGRWNPFITPYWTHRYEPVTSWQQQVATVQIPVSRVAWVPETQTVQQSVTTWKTANTVITRRTPVGAVGAAGGTSTALATAQPLPNSTPSATITPNNGAAASVAQRPFGGEALQSDPPKQATGGWQPAGSSATTQRY